MVRAKALIGIFVIVIAAATTIAVTSPSLIIFLFDPFDEGSPQFARKWRDKFDRVQKPEDAIGLDDHLGIKIFPNGDWIVFLSADSHSSYSGGTVVTKDSRGRTRAFFGHVCGGGFMLRFCKTNSIDDFFQHDQWKVHGFREFQFPE